MKEGGLHLLQIRGMGGLLDEVVAFHLQGNSLN